MGIEQAGLDIRILNSITILAQYDDRVAELVDLWDQGENRPAIEQELTRLVHEAAASLPEPGLQKIEHTK